MNTISFNAPARVAAPALSRQPVVSAQPKPAAPAASVTFGMGPGFGDNLAKGLRNLAIFIGLAGAAVGVGATLLVRGCSSEQKQAAPADQSAEIKALQDQVKALQEKTAEEKKAQ
jgi:outer membrane murein-binding lipoprotein Lpp